ncbi:Probable transcription factor At4g01260 [Linum grandiflorum]
MAPKRIPPKEDPPAPTVEEEEDKEEEEEDDSTTESEDEEQGASPEEKPSAPLSESQLTKLAIQEQDDSESEDDSDDNETDSDSDPPPSKTVKPIPSKPMEATPSKSSTKAPVSTAASKARKRETDTTAKETKRQKVSSPAVKSEDSSKKLLFQRIWDDEDEIALLNGLLEFSKKGLNPFKKIADLYDLVKQSLTIDISRTQLRRKAGRLKKKFEKNANGEDGEGKRFSNQHDQRCFDLSKKIWGSEASIPTSNARKSNRKVKGNSSSGNGANGNRITIKPLAAAENGVPEHEKEINGTKKKEGSSYKLVMLPGEDIEDIVIKKGLDMVEGSKRAEFEKRWKDVHVASLKLAAQQNQLLSDLAKSMVAAMDED